MKKRILTVGAIAIVIILITTLIVQAVSIHKMKQEQAAHFDQYLSSAVQSYEEYKRTGYEFQYEHAMFNLHSASSIALLLDDDEYNGLHGVLQSLCGSYFSSPDDFALFMDEIVEILKDYESHKSAEALYTQLNNVDNRLFAMLLERTEKID